MPQDSNISRWVAFLFAPLASIAAAFVVHAALSIFGITLDPTMVGATMLTAMVTVAGLGYKWLHNRGAYEIAHVANTTPQNVQNLERLIEERLPAPPQAPAPGAGSPAVPRAPGG